MTEEQNKVIRDEHTTGMDPEVKRYFRKIVSSFTYGLIFLMFVAMAGIYYRLAFVQGRLTLGNLIFYSIILLTLFFLLRYYVRAWRTRGWNNHQR